MLPHQQRMLEEYKELDERILRLTNFSLASQFKELSDYRQLLLREQLRWMEGYAKLLSERIAAELKM